VVELLLKIKEVGLGLGRIVTSEKEAPNLLVNLV
jgi:hypothetical protein